MAVLTVLVTSVARAEGSVRYYAKNDLVAAHEGVR